MHRHLIIRGDGLLEVLRERLKNALSERDIYASEFAEFYLVNLLNDVSYSEKIISGQDAFFSKPLAIWFMEALESDASTRIKKLRLLGDCSLIVTGLFSDYIRKTLANISWFMTIGGAAYKHLASAVSDQADFAALYLELSKNFAKFAAVLSIVAPWNTHVTTNTDLLNMYERWLQTGDEKLESILKDQGIDTE